MSSDQGVQIQALTEGSLSVADLVGTAPAASTGGQRLADGSGGAVQMVGLGVGSVVLRQGCV